ncbi:MAG: hypothetical protein CMJ32_06150 [Phycisphaerae bacterium]|nr:hypothetical protein [Phycisphaerae bacterium]
MAPGILLVISMMLLAPVGQEQTSVGMEGTRTIVHDGPLIEVAPMEEDFPVLIRIDRIRELEQGREYTIKYFALLPGEYDIATMLQYGVDRPAEIDPIRVTIVSLLPEDHGGELLEIEKAPFISSNWFWVLVGSIAFAWLVPPIVALVRRSEQHEEPIPVELPPQSLADQIEPLVLAAMEDRITLAEQARLEMLLLSYWRGQLHLEDVDHDEAITRIRQHPEAGRLLITVETWLHSNVPEGVRKQELDEVLAPYRDIKAVD